MARIILCLFWVALGLSASLAQAETFKYKYISLAQAKLPRGYSSFEPKKINDSGRVYGTAYDSSYNPHVAVYDRGTVTVLNNTNTSYFNAVNENGTVAGSVLTDPVNYITQAALFRGNQTKLISPPLLPEDAGSWANDLNDDGTALVGLIDADYNYNYWLYKNNKLTLLNFGSALIYAFADGINNEGIISGNASDSISGDDRGFRHDPSNGKTMTLNPLPTEENSLVWDINNRGNILGSSFSYSEGAAHIGLYDKKGTFHTYVVEGTPEFPHWRNSLRGGSMHFNDKDLIVISYYAQEQTSYLVPKPGVSLNLADLITNLPVGRYPSYIIDINNEGDMLGYSADYDFNISDKFLLKRIDATSP